MNYILNSSINDIKYVVPELSSFNPIELNIEKAFTPKIDSYNAFYYTVLEPFNLSHYLNPRLPIDMGLHYLFIAESIPNVLRLPIKFPDTNYKIPQELKNLINLIQRVAEYEKSFNQFHDNYFCHITYDYSIIDKGFHRFPGFHGDGIQGSKSQQKDIIEHSYILTTNPPTEFCIQPFFLKHLDESKHNFFLEFDKQANKENIYKTLPNHLYLIDPYMVHRTPYIENSTNRLFIRITYCSSELQHPKNTINPLFNYKEYDYRVDIRKNLCPNEFEIPYHLYGVSK